MTAERGACHRLLVKCEAWAPQSRAIWKSLGRACGWKHSRVPQVRVLFEKKEATPAVLAFLRETKVGQVGA